MARVRVSGMSRARRALLQLSQEGERTLRREVARSALAIQGTAKTLAPVDTGRLRNSIAVEFMDGGLSARIGTNVEYAPFVEFGTRRMGARPFLFPAFEMEWPRFVARLRRETGASFVRSSQ